MRRFFLFTMLLLASVAAHAQCSGVLSVDLTNPSFEGDPGAHTLPPEWTQCDYTPDTQPGSWGVAQVASDGNTYLGLVGRPCMAGGRISGAWHTVDRWTSLWDAP